MLQYAKKSSIAIMVMLVCEKYMAFLGVVSLLST
jgi:hypothetical protein